MEWKTLGLDGLDVLGHVNKVVTGSSILVAFDARNHVSAFNNRTHAFGSCAPENTVSVSGVSVTGSAGIDLLFGVPSRV